MNYSSNAVGNFFKRRFLNITRKLYAYFMAKVSQEINIAIKYQ